MIEAVIFTPRRHPIKSDNTVLRGINDARHWVGENSHFSDDVYAILEDGIVIGHGMVEEIYDFE